MICHECVWWKPCRPGVPCRIWHRCHFSRPKQYSAPVNCMYTNNNNRKVDKDLAYYKNLGCCLILIIWSHVCESKYHQFRSPGILYFCNVIVHICIFQLQVILDGPTVFQLNMSNWCSFKLLIICFRWIFYGLFVLLHCNSEGYFFAVIVIFILACLDVENEKKM